MSDAERVAAAVTVATTGTAAQILAAVQAQARSPVQAAVASGLTAASGGLKPQLPAGALASEPKPATVVLPQLGSGAMHLQDTTSGAAVDITLQGAAAVAAHAVVTDAHQRRSDVAAARLEMRMKTLALASGGSCLRSLSRTGQPIEEPIAWSLCGVREPDGCVREPDGCNRETDGW